MQLSNQDSLRLNVLLAQSLTAVRIDESRMVVYALSERGEACVELNPIGKQDQYLRAVRQLLSTHVLGSPGGYPVFLRRWTRMGQTRDQSLEKLLLLGEPEAIAAVAHAPGLTEDIARRAWWADPSAENARRMLEKTLVSETALGKELAEYLLEFLPFEEDHESALDTVYLILRPGLLAPQKVQSLWKRAKRKPSYYVGFLKAVPDDLPEQVDAHRLYEEVNAVLEQAKLHNTQHGAQLLRCLSGQGQCFLDTLETVLAKPANQDVVVATMEALGRYFSALGVPDEKLREIADVEARSSEMASDRNNAELDAIMTTAPHLSIYLRAMYFLALAGESLVAPIFGRTDAVGTVMRRKLETILAPMLAQIAILRGA